MTVDAHYESPFTILLQHLLGRRERAGLQWLFSTQEPHPIEEFMALPEFFTSGSALDIFCQPLIAHLPLQ
jgi:hypothetical protein